MIEIASPTLTFVNESPTPVVSTSVPAWHQRFLELLPAIRSQTLASFQTADPAAREEAVQEVVANSLVAYARLIERGKEDVAFATPLTRYAIAQVRAGRRVGSRLNVGDVTSEYCRARKGVQLESLDRRAPDDWQACLVEDRQATPAETAAIRIDFADWLATLKPRDRRLAERLAAGETTSGAALWLGVSRGRISQLRAELRNAWYYFQGEPLPALA